MEWKKEILNYALAAPGHTVDRHELRQHIYTLATKEGIEKRRHHTQLSSACWNLRQEGVVAYDDSVLRIVDVDKAKAKMALGRPKRGDTKLCADGCKRAARLAGLCYSCACVRHEAGEVILNRFGKPLAVCTQGCGRLAYRAGLCGACEWRKETVKVCRDCKTRPARINRRCDECRVEQRARQSADTGKNAPAGDHYDWVMVYRFLHGKMLERFLTAAEKTEVIRLGLRDVERGKVSSFWAWSEEVGYTPQTVGGWLREFEKDARAIGLEQQLRFCFLPDAGEPADSTLEVAA